MRAVQLPSVGLSRAACPGFSFKLFSDEQVYPQGSMNVPVRKKSKSVARAAEQTYFSHGCDF